MIDIQRHFRQSADLYEKELKDEDDGSIVGTLVRASKLVGYCRGYRDRDEAYSFAPSTEATKANE